MRCWTQHEGPHVTMVGALGIEGIAAVVTVEGRPMVKCFWPLLGTSWLPRYSFVTLPWLWPSRMPWRPSPLQMLVGDALCGYALQYLDNCHRDEIDQLLSPIKDEVDQLRHMIQGLRNSHALWQLLPRPP